MAIILVLALLSITLALSYAMMRTQATSTAIQTNANLRLNAREAALTGLGVAQRKMSDATWGGADSTFTGTLSASESFQVTYATGDASLTPASANYGEYPFRVTVTVVGQAVDPSDANKRATYTVSAVMQLLRRQLGSEPSTWNTVNQYTVYQWGSGSTILQGPVNVQGAALLKGTLAICTSAPSDAAARSRYLSDLEAMRVAGLDDWRPLSGPVTTPSSRNASVVSGTLNSLLNITTTDITASSSQPFSVPSSTPTTYRLYSGGKAYAIPSLFATYGDNLRDVTVQPDTLTNPLGVYRAGGDLDLRDNVTIRGTILAPGSGQDIFIKGRNVQLLGTDLPALAGSTARMQLPLAIVKDDFRVYESASATVRGLCLVWDEFEFVQGNDDATCDFQGRLVTCDLWLQARSSWVQNASNWSQYLTDFLTQFNNPGLPSRELYFPRWLKTNQGLNSQSLLTIKPDSSGVLYHWQDWSQPIYVPLTADGGLRWDVVRRTETP